MFEETTRPSASMVTVLGCMCCEPSNNSNNNINKNKNLNKQGPLAFALVNVNP